MKYVIIGAGPTGLSLAYNLALNNKEIVLIEQDSQLGGSWNSQWIEGKYWSENSPRVFFNTGNTQKLMKNLGFKNNDFKNVYGSFFKTNYKFILFLYKYFNILDYIIFCFAFIKFNIFTYNISLMSWLNNSYLSNNAKKAIKILSILVCDKPENTSINDFFGSLGLFFPKQMIEPNKWHYLIEDYLKTKKNVTILKNTKVIQLLDNHNNINSVSIHNLLNNSYTSINCDKVIQYRLGDNFK